MTINGALNYFKDLLSNSAFIDSPGKEARIFICHVLEMEDHLFILEKDRLELSDEDYKKAFDFVQRRLSGESVASITGTAFFYTLEFLVNDQVLIPRPETEILIEKILGFTAHLDSVRALDIGTGSGCIPITLIKEHAKMTFDAIDISPGALEIARRNQEKHEVSPEKLHLIQADIKTFLPGEEYDLIISNPPYIKSAVVDEILQNKEVSDPRQALDGGSDGLDFYRSIRKFADKYLKEQGMLFLEHGYDQKEELLQIFSSPHYQLQTYQDYARHDRILFARKIGISG